MAKQRGWRRSSGMAVVIGTLILAGPGEIAMYLKRYHDIDISQSGVWRILQRVDLSRLRYQRYKRYDRKWKRYEKPWPGHAVQVDVKFIAPLSPSSRKRLARKSTCCRAASSPRAEGPAVRIRLPTDS